MKVVFLCGSLEPACDGVGDYTRRIAGEMIRQGYQAAVVALSDPQVKEKNQGYQISDGIKVPVLRVPASLSDNYRYSIVKTWIDTFDPLWLSLQFVPFSFHPKGLPFGLSSKLKLLGTGRQWHIMFHELWVGMNIEAPMKLMFLGWLQRRILYALLNGLKPVVINTQTQLYLDQLARLGFKASCLPLFSNIPIAGKRNLTSKTFENIDEKDPLVLVLFGGIHSGAPVAEFAEEVALFSRKYRVGVVLTILGRCGEEQAHWIAVWKSAGLSVNLLGELAPEAVSEVLQDASLGISTTPIALVEKSGAVAAMRVHQLPVICVSGPWHPRKGNNWFIPLGIVEYRSGNFEECVKQKVNLSYAHKISDVCRQLADSLKAENSYGKFRVPLVKAG